MWLIVRGKDAGWTHIAMILTLLSMLNINTTAQGLQFENVPKDPPSEGEDCRTPAGESGICKYVNACEPYMTKAIDYYSLGHCTFIGFARVVCCPTATGWSRNIEQRIVGSSSIGSDSPTTQRSLKNPKDTEPQNGRLILNTTSNTPEQRPHIATFSLPVGSTPVSVTPVSTKPSTEDTDMTSFDNERPSQAACRRYRKLNPASLIPLILHGSPVAPQEFPHMAGLLYPNKYPPLDIRCGSSLISERYVLTAAHCVSENPLPVIARLGAVTWNSAEYGILPIDVEFENITIHPGYRSSRHDHDIALIRLKKDVDFTTFVSPGCLYSDVKDIDSATPLIVIGWGVTNLTTGARSNILLKTELRTVQLSECNATIAKHTKYHRAGRDLNQGQYCAFDPGLENDSCDSDSGGPLMVVENKLSTIVGVVSFGYSCGTTVPSVYTRVAHYLDWIESIVWPS